ncbi:Nitrogen permease regulator 2 [Cichlidogyrus casuarinus]|uniref:Nitrogen permease regulator 2 n=1 Tax=Cichlidogyrus casuarinus TaxID=1844966 RepID=A0ABD2QF28_9PLAT
MHWLLTLWIVASLCDSSVSYFGMGQFQCGLERPRNSFKIGILAPFNPKLIWSEARKPSVKAPFPLYIQPAAMLALEDARREGLSINVSLVWGDTRCNVQSALDRLFEMILDNPVNALIGPLCTSSLAAVNRVAGHRFRLPIVTTLGYELEFGNKTEYPLLTRIGGHYGSMDGLFPSMFRIFGFAPRNYTNLVIMHVKDRASSNPDSAKPYFYASKAIINFEWKHKFQAMIVDLADIRAKLQLASSMARVVILCAPMDVIKTFMMEAHRLGYTKGDYVFLAMEVFRT